jgi:hypothetical protein
MEAFGPPARSSGSDNQTSSSPSSAKEKESLISKRNIYFSSRDKILH